MIADELRKYASSLAMKAGASTTEVKGALEEIADHIDSDCRGVYSFADRIMAAADKREEITAFGVDYIPCPLDADGEPIHLQDRMSWDNGTFNVHELNLTADGWTTWDELHGYTVHADQCHHVKPDSWERIISDATALGAQMKRRTHQIGDFVERCKKLAGEVE